MKSISVTVVKSDYAAFRRAAKKQKKSIAALIRDAMAHYRREKLDERPQLTELLPLVGARLRREARLPSRAEIYDDIFDDGSCR